MVSPLIVFEAKSKRFNLPKQEIMRNCATQNRNKNGVVPKLTHSLEGVITIFFNPTMQHVLLAPNALITFRFVIDSQRISREIYVSYFVLPRWQEIKQLLESNGM